MQGNNSKGCQKFELGRKMVDHDWLLLPPGNRSGEYLWKMPYPTFKSASYPGKVSPLLVQRRDMVIPNCNITRTLIED